MKLQKCRVCSTRDFKDVLHLGSMPPANEFLDHPDAEETAYPLNVVWCEECRLMQIDEIVPPEELFEDYVYVSGTSDRMQRHFDELTADACTRYELTADERVLDIGSNDGTLLSCFKSRGLDVLGVEPAANIAEIAQERGIDTVNRFFDKSTGTYIADTHGTFDLVTATNVFAHTHDVHSFLDGVSQLLSEDGVFVIEVPYLVDLLEKTEFDTIYHEHLSYFSVHPLQRLFRANDFKLIRATRTNIHGGSIRVFATPATADREPDHSVEELLGFERAEGLTTNDVYDTFATQVRQLRTDLLTLIEKIQSNGETIAGYGAAAKGNTLLNYYDIGPDTIEYIADKNELKQGKFTPGTNIEVVSPDRIYADQPDYLLILAWNFSEEIMEQQSEFKEAGGQFITPVPEVSII